MASKTIPPNKPAGWRAVRLTLLLWLTVGTGAFLPGCGSVSSIIQRAAATSQSGSDVSQAGTGADGLQHRNFDSDGAVESVSEVQNDGDTDPANPAGE